MSKIYIGAPVHRVPAWNTGKPHAGRKKRDIEGETAQPQKGRVVEINHRHRFAVIQYDSGLRECIKIYRRARA